MIFGALPSALKSEVLSCFGALLACGKSEHTGVRHMAARAIATCASSMTVDIMNAVLDDVLPLLGAAQQTNWRQGAIETIYRILCYCLSNVLIRWFSSKTYYIHAYMVQGTASMVFIPD